MRKRLLAILRAIQLAWVALIGWGPRRPLAVGVCSCPRPLFRADVYAGGVVVECFACGRPVALSMGAGA